MTNKTCGTKGAFANLFDSSGSAACTHLTSDTDKDIEYSLVEDNNNKGGVRMKYSGGDLVNPSDANDTSRWSFELVLGCNSDAPEFNITRYEFNSSTHTYTIFTESKEACPEFDIS